MRHIYRKELYDGNVKCFHVTRNVEITHNHRPLKCLPKNGQNDCFIHNTNPNLGYFLHYKREIKLPEQCNFEDKTKCAVNDTTIWKYYEHLNRNMKRAIQNIF